MPDRIRLVVVIGVSGAGKSTLARALADRLGVTFLDADDFHPAANRRKMAAGIPLNDTDRAPWMKRITARLAEVGRSDTVVLAHSGLRRRHREALRQCGRPAWFLQLVGSERTLRTRLSRRQGHYMTASLLATQLQDFQSTEGETDVTDIDIEQSTAAQVAQCIVALGRAVPR